VRTALAFAAVLTTPPAITDETPATINSVATIRPVTFVFRIEALPCLNDSFAM
jgi:hypothetical protein